MPTRASRTRSPLAFTGSGNHQISVSCNCLNGKPIETRKIFPANEAVAVYRQWHRDQGLDIADMKYPGAQSDMRRHEGVDWRVGCDRGDDDEEFLDFVTLRRVGWLDQKGRVWTDIPADASFDGGDLIPLLIDARGDS